jgi:hypothetical protein
MSPDAVMQREPAGTEDAVLKGEDFVVDGEQYEDTVADGRTCVDDDGDVFADDALLLSFKVRVWQGGNDGHHLALSHPHTHAPLPLSAGMRRRSFLPATLAGARVCLLLCEHHALTCFFLRNGCSCIFLTMSQLARSLFNFSLSIADNWIGVSCKAARSRVAAGSQLSKPFSSLCSSVADKFAANREMIARHNLTSQRKVSMQCHIGSMPSIVLNLLLKNLIRAPSKSCLTQNIPSKRAVLPLFWNPHLPQLHTNKTHSVEIKLEFALATPAKVSADPAYSAAHE